MRKRERYDERKVRTNLALLTGGLLLAVLLNLGNPAHAASLTAGEPPPSPTAVIGDPVRVIIGEPVSVVATPTASPARSAAPPSRRAQTAPPADRLSRLLNYLDWRHGRR